MIGLCALAAFAGEEIRRHPVYQSVQQKIEQIKRSKKPSTSRGGLTTGSLENACELPADGVGYRLVGPGRKTNFGTDEMVFGLMEIGAKMYIKYGDKGAFLVGDISAEHGGKLKPHINHQGGRDVDLGLYIANSKGEPLGNRMVRFDRDGRAGDGTLLDLERNWEFICAMLESPYFQVDAILFADWLKKLVLDHARAKLARTKNPNECMRQKRLIELAEKVIEQPRSSPHDNHFHLRIKLSDEDRRLGGRDY